MNELQQIFLAMCTEHAYGVTAEAVQRAANLFTEIHANKGEQFGNGRTVRNMFDRCVLNHSRRLASKRKPSRKELQTIVQTDIAELKDVEW